MSKSTKETTVSRMKVGTVSTVALLLIIGSLAGCAGKRITFRIVPDERANNAQPLCVVIREVNKKSFLIEDYDKIADLVYTDPPDESVLAWHVVLPGKKEAIKVKRPGDVDVGIYAMFTSPEEEWKIMLEQPLGSKYELIIQDNSLRYRKRGFWTWLRGIF